ncbi:glycosyltransferase family 2 protein [Kitasatospora azatica]|uniref:glycosyltransferase family 2 protein n=1 Tax=Kitasatospora azatica TaxID=58347 RepID=UPI0005671ABB|nr:glycosyltransferase family 2 protein [Kitasatospora azatica]
MPISSPDQPWWRRPSWWLAAAAAAHQADGLWQLRKTLAWADQPPALGTSAAEPEGLRFHIVLPVLREQGHIADALDWFVPLLGGFPGSTLTVVTTAREEREREHLVDSLTGLRAGQITGQRFPQLTDTEVTELAKAATASTAGVLPRHHAVRILRASPLTSQIVGQELRTRPAGPVPVRHVHYEGTGRKAAQVNAAVERITAAGEGDYIAVYDIDSRPDALLLGRTAAFIGQHLAADGHWPHVVQQSARFTTQQVAERWWDRNLCQGAARLQTLWTLRREIPALRRYSASARRAPQTPAVDTLRRGLAQTVGHGLLVRVDTFRKVGGLPTFTVLDDVPFGYRLTIEGIPVDSLPHTYTVAAPEQVGELLAQGSRWFQNYLDYPACFTQWRGEGEGVHRHAAALAVAVFRGGTWMLATPVTAACLALTLLPRTAPATRVTAATALWLGVVAPVRMLGVAESGRAPGAVETVRQCGQTLAAYLLKSAGPALAIGQWAACGTRQGVLSPKSNHRAAMSAPAGRNAL